MRLSAAFVAAFISCFAGAALAEDRIPPELVGVWANDEAVLSGQGALFEGAGFYLRADGRGAVIGGPPPIGFYFSGTFNAADDALTFDFAPEKGQPCVTGRALYDRQAKSLDIGSGSLLKRRLEDVPAWFSQDIERKFTPCAPKSR